MCVVVGKVNWHCHSVADSVLSCTWHLVNGELTRAEVVAYTYGSIATPTSTDTVLVNPRTWCRGTWILACRYPLLAGCCKVVIVVEHIHSRIGGSNQLVYSLWCEGVECLSAF